MAKKRKLTKHQKKLKAAYNKEYANLKKRMKRLETAGYHFDYEIEQKATPTGRDIERIKSLRGEKLKATGSAYNPDTGEIISRPTSAGRRSVKSLMKPAAEPVEAPRTEPTETPRHPRTHVDPETGEVYGIDAEPIFENYALMRLLSVIQEAKHKTSRPDVVARASYLENYLSEMVDSFGLPRVANAIEQLMADNPDIFDDTFFYEDAKFAQSMEKTTRAFYRAEMMNETEYRKQSESWQSIADFYENTVDYDE